MSMPRTSVSSRAWIDWGPIRPTAISITATTRAPTVIGAIHCRALGRATAARSLARETCRRGAASRSITRAIHTSGAARIKRPAHGRSKRKLSGASGTS